MGETTIRMRERNGERLVGKDSRDDLILVKEKGKTRSHIYTYATGLPSVRLFLTRLFAYPLDRSLCLGRGDQIFCNH